MNGVKFSRRERSCLKTGASPRRSRKNPPAPFISMPCSRGGWPATGVCTMRCSLSLLVPVIILAAPAAGLAQSRYNVGTPLSQEEIRSFDFMLGPEGKELPPGHGTAREGAGVFAKRCAVCHGQGGQGGVVRRLVIGSPRKPHQGASSDTEKSGPSY